MDPISTRVALGAAGAGGAAEPGEYIEDLFSTYLYDGNNSTQTITNGIDLAGEGGLVWLKNRNDTGGLNHFLYDTARGANKQIITNSSSGEGSLAVGWVFNSDGFTQNNSWAALNASGNTYASWTFRKAPGFFDVVTYTGTGTAGLTVNHSLGSVPGFFVVKRTDSSGAWRVYHRSLGATKYLELDSTNAAATNTAIFNDTEPTSTQFTLGYNSSVNASGGTYVAYLFAHDEQIFGDTGSESVIKCGSYTGNGSADGPTVDLGWEPQFVLAKSATTGGPDWWLVDNTRKWQGGDADLLRPNISNAEASPPFAELNSQGFKLATTSTDINRSGTEYVYVAIRRGPMKQPTSGTDVFQTLLYAGSSSDVTRSTNIAVDALFTQRRNIGVPYALDRIRGGTNYISTSSSSSEGTQTNAIYEFGYNYLEMGAGLIINDSGKNYCLSMFRRAPGFFDVVAYTGTGVTGTVPHNLGVVPELYITKCRTITGLWAVLGTALGNATDNYLQLQAATQMLVDADIALEPTATTIGIGTKYPNDPGWNRSGEKYIAYLFATCPGVSKVGSYTGTASTVNVDCGFTAGARYVLIKRTDATGDWYVWDSTRGIVSGNDPYLLLNSSATEVTNTDYIDPLSSGFQITSSAPAAINASGGSYIFLAIA